MKYLYIILIFGADMLLAQKHDNNWVMGYEHNSSPPFGNMILHFDSGSPEIIELNLKMDFDLTGMAFSDSSGNLLFYTNGIRIYNKSFQLMENGDTINPGQIWQNNKATGYICLASPFAFYQPSKPHIIYLIHQSVSYPLAHLEHLYYTIIDISANNGLGRVVEKNKILMQGDLIWANAVKHGNGKDWWIMCAQSGSIEHDLFLLDQNGISGPYVQSIGPEFVDEEFFGKSTFSPDGSLYIRNDANVNNPGSRVYNFDRCTGELSNVRLLPHQYYQQPWTAEFSTDNRFLYLSRPGYVWSYDLTVPFDALTRDIIATWELNYYPYYPWSTGYGNSQRGPDGKIYWVCAAGGSQAMNVMHLPDMPSDAVNIEEEGFHLPRWNGYTCNQHPNYRLGKWLGSPCDTSHFASQSGFMDNKYDSAIKAQAVKPAGRSEQLNLLPNDILLEENLDYQPTLRDMMQAANGGLPRPHWFEENEKPGSVIIKPDIKINEPSYQTKEKD